MVDGVRELCATGREPQRRALTQYLDACDESGATLVPDVEPLLSASYRSALSAFAGGRERQLERRNRFLDYLLATCGEEIDPVIPLPASRPDDPGLASRAQQLRIKLGLLRRLTTAGEPQQEC